MDVGSGTGHLLFQLKSLGYKNLQGVDPFISRDIETPGGPTIRKALISDIAGEFDVIVMNHSFEHMADPHGVFQQLQRLLDRNGWLVIRTPVATGVAWKKYGVSWIQLDAPRHLFIHTTKSIEVLARAAGLMLDSVIYDSTEFQFWGSEQYRLDIALKDKRSYKHSPSSSVFSKSQIANFSKEAEELNRKGEGDQACFYLRSAL